MNTRRRFLTKIFCFAGLASAQAETDDRPGESTFEGVKAIQAAATADSLADRLGLTESVLKNYVEARLRTSGVSVVSEAGGHLDNGYLGVQLTVVGDPDGPDLACNLGLTLHQVVILARLGTATKAFMRAITWQTGSTLYLGKHVLEQSVRNTLADHMDEFINIYLKENPKK